MNAQSLSISLVFFAITFGLSADEPRPTITVRGSAKTSLPADSATISIQLEGRSMDADQAFEKVDKQTQLLQALMKQNEVADNNFRLQPIMIISHQTRDNNMKGRSSSNNQSKQVAQKQPAVESDEEETSKTAYQATRELTIHVNNLSKLNAIHLGLVKNGVERIKKIEYKSSKSTEEYAKLRQAAVREAFTKATAMAGELGAKLSSIKTMVDQSQPLPTNWLTAISHSDDPFDVSRSEQPSGTLIHHVTQVDVVFYLDKTELPANK